MRNDTQILESIEQQLISMKMKLKRIEELGNWFHAMCLGIMLGVFIGTIGGILIQLVVF